MLVLKVSSIQILLIKKTQNFNLFEYLLSRSGNEEKILSLLTPLNVNCHASDGRKSTPLHLAAGYNRTRIVKLLLQHGADVHAKVNLDIKDLTLQ